MNPCPKPGVAKDQRNRGYLDWIRTQPCGACRQRGSTQPHHVIGVGLGGRMGSKAPDWHAIPLCDDCHRAVHAHGDSVDQLLILARTIDTAMRDGALAWGSH